MNMQYWAKLIKDWNESTLPVLITRQITIPLELTINRAFSLIGPRRAGKTSEMLMLAKNISEKKGRDKTIYINFERADLGALHSKDLVSLLDAYQQVFPKNKKEDLWLFLDEIQNVIQWELFVRTCIDQKIKVIITGSSSKLLSKELATSMSGRNLSYNIFPLSFKEFLAFKSFNIPKLLSSKEEATILNYFDEYLNFGGYPEVALYPSEKERILRDIFDTAILRDVIERHKIRNVFLMKTLIKALLSSKEFSANKFYNYLKSQQIKSSKDAIYKYVNYLEDSFFIFMLNKFSLSYKKSEQSLPKVYFVDNGLLRIHAVDDKGRLLENTVFVELLRRNKDIAYYQTTTRNEVDFIIKNGKKVEQLIQVCYNLSDFQTRDREIRSLLAVSKEFSCNDLLILSMDQEEEITIEDKNIKVLPVWKWLMEK
ncbi:MAG: ATP-binding protein [Candidatus Woesearchaeota archaeon]